MSENNNNPQDHRDNEYALKKESIINRNLSANDGLRTYTNKNSIGTDYNYKHKVVWINVLVFLILHLVAIYGFVSVLLGECKLYTVLWTIFLLIITAHGVTIGAHRYYTHKSFKAKLILRIIFLVLQTMAGQNSMWTWCRDHRQHHRYSDTDGDPHNARRGFFFSHVGWLLTKKHPLVHKLGKNIDMTDLQADSLVMFQKKYYYILYAIFAVVFPVVIPVYFFGESLINAMVNSYFLRYAALLNGTWLVNSFAHLYGTRPYDRTLQPVETWFVSLLSNGEGWHNYHHIFPWDYNAAEISMHFNGSGHIIRFFEHIGLAWDLKSASPELVKKRILRTGDGTHYVFGNEEAKSAIQALGYRHPINPSYRTVTTTSEIRVKPEGLPLFHEEDVLNQ